MKQEDTKQKILNTALELFSDRGYDSVSVDEIAKAVGIKAPSLYNHFSGKRAIFDALVKEISTEYEKGTDKLDIHVQNFSRDVQIFTEITEAGLFEKVKQIFEYSLHNEKIRRFRKLMTIEQFRSSELGELYTERYVTRIINYHADIFRKLIAAGELQNSDPETLAFMCAAPVFTLIGICDRQPEKENECLKKLQNHVQLFFKTFNISRGNKK